MLPRFNEHCDRARKSHEFRKIHYLKSHCILGDGTDECSAWTFLFNHKSARCLDMASCSLILLTVSLHVCRRTERTKVFEMVLKINFSNGCGCLCSQINIPFDPKVRILSSFANILSSAIPVVIVNFKVVTAKMSFNIFMGMQPLPRGLKCL